MHHSEPLNVPGTLISYDDAGRRGPVRAIGGMLTVREAAALTGVSALTIRLWTLAFGNGVGAVFGPSGPILVHPHVVATLALLRDRRGALPPHSCEKGSVRHHVVMLAVYAAIKACDVPPDALIDEFRRRLSLPPLRPKRISPAVQLPAAQPVEVLHAVG